MSDIKIICDSLSDITEEYIKKYDIEFMPLNIIFGDKEYKDRVTLDTTEFYKIIREENIIPKTSQVSYGEFYKVSKKYLDQGKKILYISAASSATGTYQSAVMAKNDLESEDIEIIDSNTLCFGISILLIKAGELRDKGYSLKEIVDSIENMKDNVYVSFACDDLEYLNKGGRISSAKAIIGKVLNIKPICVIKDGLVENVLNARGKKALASKMIEVAKENNVLNLSDQTVYIGYSDDMKEMERLKEKINDEYNPKEIKTFIIGSGIGTHGVPGTTGFICLKNN